MNFFVTAIGGYVLRGNNPIFVKDYAMAMKLFELQDDEYKFRPVAYTSSNICVSCEG
jgi:hypothetical protein